MSQRHVHVERPPDADAPEQIHWQGQFIAAKTRGRWEYVSRARGIRAAVILAHDDSDVLLVEQFRVPLGRNCLELPAGLVGDGDGADGEHALDAAKRELEEETGYRAENWANLGEFFSSPGMVSEGFTLLRATGLTKVGDGGGTHGENITVHKVPLSKIQQTIAEHRAVGTGIDVRLLLLIGSDLISG